MAHPDGATTWLTVRSYISTIRKDGFNAIAGNPWPPTNPTTT
ncbi:hypothetical protein [Amycolatopsis speibonae]|uniref:Integrase n=1 Tax=Amycolatopsis speibonae TaxID=1450224 RepID=A0ABV7PA00_9PSEU